MPDQFAFSAQQVAGRWGVSSRQVYDLCSKGELGHLRIGGLIRIRLTDVEAYEARQWHAPGSMPQISGSSSAEIVSMSAGGTGRHGSAFRQGRRTAAKQPAS